MLKALARHVKDSKTKHSSDSFVYIAAELVECISVAYSNLVLFPNTVGDKKVAVPFM